jgi:hypothetical protein
MLLQFIVTLIHREFSKKTNGLARLMLLCSMCTVLQPVSNGPRKTKGREYHEKNRSYHQAV